MANLGNNFDATQHAEMQSFEPLPAGEYVAQVVSSDVKPTRAGTGQYVKLEWEVLDGEYTGRKVFANYNIVNPNPKAQEIGEREFAAACRAMGQMHVTETESLHAIPCVLKLKIQAGDDKYGPSNRIVNYTPATALGAGIGAAPQQQAPAAATPAAGKPVWQQ